MNSNHSPKQWFLQKLSSEVFTISAIGWLILFLMETAKNGLVSNYLSLPHLAFLVVVFGIVMLILKPQAEAVPASKPLSNKEIIVLTVLTIIIIFLIPFITEFSSALTILLIFVTVLSLWLGTILLKE